MLFGKCLPSHDCAKWLNGKADGHALLKGVTLKGVCGTVALNGLVITRGAADYGGGMDITGGTAASAGSQHTEESGFRDWYKDMFDH